MGNRHSSNLDRKMKLNAEREAKRKMQEAEEIFAQTLAYQTEDAVYEPITQPISYIPSTLRPISASIGQFNGTFYDENDNMNYQSAFTTGSLHERRADIDDLANPNYRSITCNNAYQLPNKANQKYLTTTIGLNNFNQPPSEAKIYTARNLEEATKLIGTRLTPFDVNGSIDDEVDSKEFTNDDTLFQRRTSQPDYKCLVPR